MKIVINKCFGGFSLSHEGMMKYAEIKGIKLYPEDNKKFKSLEPTYWLVPPDRRVTDREDDFYTLSFDERRDYNQKHQEQTIYSRDIKRDDPALVRTVEEIGSAADGRCAELAVIEIPDGVDWEIDEYDGLETIREKHRSWS